jgi:hypothetical protein
VEEALEELKQNYGRSNIVPLVWHRWDNFETLEIVKRFNYYDEIEALPTTFFDGMDNIRGRWDGIYDVFEPIVLDHLEEDPYVAIDLSGSQMKDTGGTLNIRLEAIQGLPLDDVDVYVVLYEKELTDEFTVRDVLLKEPLTISQEGEIQDVQVDFIIDPELFPPVKPENAGIVVFLQSFSTKRVLNACELSYVDVEVTPETAIISRGTDLDFTVDLQNITPFAQSFDVWVDVVMPDGNNHPAMAFKGPVPVNTPGEQGESGDLTLSIPDDLPADDYRIRVGIGNYDQPDHWEYDYMMVSVTD